MKSSASLYLCYSGKFTLIQRFQILCRRDPYFHYWSFVLCRRGNFLLGLWSRGLGDGSTRWLVLFSKGTASDLFPLLWYFSLFSDSWKLLPSKLSWTIPGLSFCWECSIILESSSTNSFTELQFSNLISSSIPASGFSVIFSGVPIHITLNPCSESSGPLSCPDRVTY